MRLRTSAYAALVALLAGVPVVAVAAPSAPARGGAKGFRQTAAAYTPRFHVPLAPGVDLDGFSSSSLGASTDSNLVTVDLAHAGVRTGVLMSRVTDVAPVRTLAQRVGAVAAVNGDYYAITGSQAPTGAIVRDGQLVKGRRGGTTVTGVGTDGLAREAPVRLDATATWGGGAPVPVEVLNSDLDGRTLPRDSIEIIDGGWGDRPIAFANAPRKTGIVAVDRGGHVLQTWRAVKGQRVPAHGMLLVGTGRRASIAGLPRGSTVRHHLGMTTDAATPWQWGLGEGLQLVRGGEAVHNYRDDSDSHSARTAIGWRDGGRTMVLLTVERHPGSVGQGVNEIADELVAQGLTDAVLLDGGGSTTLMARQQGDPTSGQVGGLQDGFQRPVPIGVGVWVPRGSGRLLDLAATLDDGTVFTGLHRRVTYRGWDEWYGPATVPPAAVAITTDQPGLLVGDGPGLVRALRPGDGHVQASAPAAAPGAAGPAYDQVFVHVAGAITSLTAPGEVRLAPGSSATLRLTGSDGSVTAPVDAVDVDRATDGTLVDTAVLPDGGLKVTAKPGTSGVASVVMTAGTATTTTLVRLAYAEVPLVDPARVGSLRVTGGKAAVISAQGRRGLRVQPDPGPAVVTPTGAAAALPAGARQLAVDVIGDGHPHHVTLVLADAAGRQRPVDLGVVRSAGLRRLQVAVPAGATSLVALRMVRSTGDTGGYLVVTGLLALV